MSVEGVETRVARVRIFVATVILLATAGSIPACQLIYPDGYVEPTTEDYIVASRVAFWGTVIGLRGTDGEVTYEAIDCYDQGADATPEGVAACEAVYDDSAMITGIVRVDKAIRGIESGALYELRRGEGGGACDHHLQVGEQWLVTDRDVRWLLDAPSSEDIKAWRALEQR